MGGMIAQELAAHLARRGTLLSLSLAVTCRGLRPLPRLAAPLLDARLLQLLLGACFIGGTLANVEILMRAVGVLLLPCCCASRRIRLGLVVAWSTG